MHEYLLNYNESGFLDAIYFTDHDISFDEALSDALEIWDEEGELEDIRFGFEQPRRVWLPVFLEEYDVFELASSDAHGGQPVTVVKPRDTWPHRCPICGERGTIGITVFGDGSEFSLLAVDESEIIHPVSDAERIWLCRDHANIYSTLWGDYQALCGAKCTECSHSLGGHRRPEGNGRCWGENPFGFDVKERIPCNCNIPSPHQVRVTLDDIRHNATFDELWRKLAQA